MQPTSEQQHTQPGQDRRCDQPSHPSGLQMARAAGFQKDAAATPSPTPREGRAQPPPRLSQPTGPRGGP
jgi:hypothetical protein